MSLLEVNNIHVYIHSFYILQGISFEVPKGEVTVFLGRNGSGKTTAMKAILGLLPPKQGSIRYKGKEISRLPAHKIVQRGIGYVPDTRRIFNTLTVEQNLVVAMRKSGRTNQGDRFESIFNLFPDLKQFWKNKARSLSGGQQQMLAVARALVNENDLLLIDEPTEGLSPLYSRNLLKSLNQLKELKTILLVEQNFRSVTALGDRYYIFDDGKIVAHGDDMAELTSNKELVSRHLGVTTL